MYLAISTLDKRAMVIPMTQFDAYRVYNAMTDVRHVHLAEKHRYVALVWWKEVWLVDPKYIPYDLPVWLDNLPPYLSCLEEASLVTDGIFVWWEDVLGDIETELLPGQQIVVAMGGAVIPQHIPVDDIQIPEEV